MINDKNAFISTALSGLYQMNLTAFFKYVQTVPYLFSYSSFTDSLILSFTHSFLYLLYCFFHRAASQHFCAEVGIFYFVCFTQPHRSLVIFGHWAMIVV